MILDKLKTWSYYQRKLPLYLQNSYGILDHFYIIFEILLNSDMVADDILKGFDVFAEDYSKYMSRMSDDVYKLDILDKIGEIYGVSRNFNVSYVENNVKIIKELRLTNEEFHKLILTRIVQSNYNGTYEDARMLYDKIKLPIYMLKNNYDANVRLILDTGKVENNQNIIDMFKANLFTLKSVGITYTSIIGDISLFAQFDDNDDRRYFDKGLWS